MKRFLSIAYWLIPPLFCLVLYWYGLLAWFQQDDFAWLNLAQDMREGRSLLSAMFKPMEGQGSLRPLGERAYYLGLPALFGLNALPFRAVAFLTQFGSLALAMRIVQRMTGSRMAALAAPLLWLANSKLATVMTWSAEYMLIMCGFFLLLALHLFIRHADTGERRYLAWCWAAFLAGFGALESNVVFPLLAASYAWLFARNYFRKTLPMFAVSAAYTVAHMWFAPKASAGPYAIHIDWRLPATFWKYWQWAFVPSDFKVFTRFAHWTVSLGALLLTAALLSYVVRQAWRGRWAPCWFLGWFAITLLPVLAIPSHISDYYLTLPTLGLAMLGADALVKAWNAGWAARALAASLALFFLAGQLPSAWGGTKWRYDYSQRGRAWVKGVEAVRARHPDKTVLLTGVDDGLFWNAVAHKALRVVNVGDVWLAPGTESKITSRWEFVDPRSFVLPRERMARQFPAGEIEVYDMRGPNLVRVTDRYRATRAIEQVGRVFWVDVADPAEASRFSEGWGVIEEGFRWMGGRATLRIPGAAQAGQEFWLKGTCVRKLLENGPATLTVKVNGDVAGRAKLTQGDAPFEFAFPLPPGATGKPEMEITLELDRTFQTPPDERHLGLLFGKMGIR